MAFNSLTFIGFLSLTLTVFYLLKSVRAQNICLLSASYLFYGWLDWRFVFLLFTKTLVDFLCGRFLAITGSTTRRKALLATSLVANLGVLAFFKYFNFFADGLAHLLAIIGWSVTTPALKILLPIGISFYTFQSLAYVFEVYRGRQEAESDFCTYALYVSYFPQLLSGPIEQPGRLLPQIKSAKRIRAATMEEGLWLILIGFFLKYAVGDFSYPEVDRLFKDPGSWHSGSLISGALLFSFQIFGDFAGYSSIACGVSLLFGIRLIANFRRPYFAVNISDFWRRWHISLSSWLRDYAYIFWLGGSRKGRFRTYLNIVLTMTLCGLWHGAGWTYVVWGLFHGVALSTHRFFMSMHQPAPYLQPLQRTVGRSVCIVVSGCLTFLVVTLGWVIFRAPTLDLAWTYLSVILRMDQPWRIMPLVPFVACMLCLGEVLSILVEGAPVGKFGRLRGALLRQPVLVSGSVLAMLFISIVLFRSATHVPFLYFQF